MADLPFRIVVRDDGTATIERFTSNVEKSGRRVQKSSKRTKKGFDRTTSSLKRMGGAAVAMKGQMLAVAAAMTGVFLAVKSAATRFANFQQEMNKTRVLTNATQKEFEMLRATALELGRTTSFSASEAARGMSLLGQAGLEANQVLSAIPDTLQLAAAAAIDLGAAADIVTNILSGMQLPIEDLTKATDVLTQAFTSSNTDLLQLGEAFKFVGPVATNAGFAFEETAATLALLAKAGFKASIAGTGLRRIITRLQAPTGIAAKTLKRLGIEVFDASGKMNSMLNILKQFEKAPRKAGDELRIFGDRAGPAMQILLGQGSAALERMIDLLENSTGRAAEVAGVRLQGLTGAWKQMTSAVDVALILIGDEMSPALIELTRDLKGVANIISETAPAMGDLLTKAFSTTEIDKLQDSFFNFGSAAEIVIKSFAFIGKAILAFRTIWAGLKIAVFQVVKSIVDGLLLIKNPILDSLIPTFEFFIKTIEKVAELFDDVFSSPIRQSIIGLLPAFTNLNIFVTRMFNDLRAPLEEFVGELTGSLGRGITSIGDAFSKLGLDTMARDWREGGRAISEAGDDVIAFSKLTIEEKIESMALAQRNFTAALEKGASAQDLVITSGTILTDSLKQFVETQKEAGDVTNLLTEFSKELAVSQDEELDAIFKLAVKSTELNKIRDNSIAKIKEEADERAKGAKKIQDVVIKTTKVVQEQTQIQIFAVSNQLDKFREGILGLAEFSRSSLQSQLVTQVKFQNKMLEAFEERLGKEMDLEKRRRIAMKLSAQQLGGALLGLAEQLGGEAFKIAKKFAIAEAIIHGILAVQKVLSSNIPYPANLVAAAAMVVTTVANVAQIQSTGSGGGGGGGSAGSAVSSDDISSSFDDALLQGEPAEEALPTGPSAITINIRGFVGDEAELGRVLAPIIREAVGDDVQFGLSLT